MPQVLLIVLIAVVIVATIVWGAWRKKKRREELTAFARHRGLTFTAGQLRLEGRWPEFDCLRRGSDRYAYNVMQGDWSGRPICAFDYHYETHSHGKHGRRTHHHHFSAVVLASPLPLRPLSIRPENLLDKMAQAFGFEDIDFESAEFSRRFCVKSPDRKWAYDVLHARTIEHLLRMPAFHVEFARNSVIAWRSSTFSVLEFTAAAEVVRGVLDRLPGYVTEQQAQGA